MSVANLFPVQGQDEAKSIDYTRQLIRIPSVTPNDNGCQVWLMEKLKALGFACHQFQVNGVSNLVASIGHGPKTIAFAGHTDVVPPGPLEKWQVNPYEGAIVDGQIIGRGAADMKSGIAAMLAAIERHITAGKAINQRLLLLITSDEEGEAEDGSKQIQAYLKQQGIQLNYCIVGEPTAGQHTGDAIKVGRRGAVSARLTVHGKQGHVAYPQYADNAIHKMGKVIAALNTIEWDQGSEDFPGTSLQITHIDSGDFTDNIVPARCQVCFNIRYSHRYDQKQLESLLNEKIAAVCEGYQLQWERPCEPYFTAADEADPLIRYVEQAIHKNTGSFPLLSTAGGTSDGRFFAQPGTQVVEVGVPNHSIHQVNERVHIADLITLEDIYTDLLEDLLI